LIYVSLWAFPYALFWTAGCARALADIPEQTIRVAPLTAGIVIMFYVVYFFFLRPRYNAVKEAPIPP
jgi:hypothetical protein